MLEGLDKLAGGVGKAVETVPELYEDAFQPAAKESGKTLAIIPSTINALLADLRIWNASREYKVATAIKLLEEKFKKIGDEKITSPEPYVAVPALEAFFYSINCKELRDLYINLLAHAMYEDTKYSVHPAFVSVTMQLSPLDAQVFKKIMEREINPCVNLVYENSNGNFIRIMQNLTDLTLSDPELISVSIENLKRMNLIYVPEDGFYIKESVYNPIIQGNFYITQKTLHPQTKDGFKFTHQKKQIVKTDFGKSFYEMCVLEPR